MVYGVQVVIDVFVMARKLLADIGFFSGNRA